MKGCSLRWLMTSPLMIEAATFRPDQCKGQLPESLICVVLAEPKATVWSLSSLFRFKGHHGNPVLSPSHPPPSISTPIAHCNSLKIPQSALRLWTTRPTMHVDQWFHGHGGLVALSEALRTTSALKWPSSQMDFDTHMVTCNVFARV